MNLAVVKASVRTITHFGDIELLLSNTKIIKHWAALLGGIKYILGSVTVQAKGNFTASAKDLDPIFSTIEEIHGDVTVVGTPLQGIRFASLNWVTGTFTVRDNAALAELGTGALATVGEHIKIENNAMLLKVLFPSLLVTGNSDTSTYIAYIRNNDALRVTSIGPIATGSEDVVLNLNNELYINNNAQMKNLTFGRLDAEVDIHVYDNEALQRVVFPMNTQDAVCNGDVDPQDCLQLTANDCSKVLFGTLIESKCPNMCGACDWANFSSTIKSFRAYNNPALQTVDALPLVRADSVHITSQRKGYSWPSSGSGVPTGTNALTSINMGRLKNASGLRLDFLTNEKLLLNFARLRYVGDSDGGLTLTRVYAAHAEFDFPALQAVGTGGVTLNNNPWLKDYTGFPKLERVVGPFDCNQNNEKRSNDAKTYAFGRDLPSLKCVGSLKVMYCEKCGPCVKRGTCGDKSLSGCKVQCSDQGSSCTSNTCGTTSTSYSYYQYNQGYKTACSNNRAVFDGTYSRYTGVYSNDGTNRQMKAGTQPICQKQVKDIQHGCPEQFPINAPGIAQTKVQLLPARKSSSSREQSHCSEQGYETTKCD